MSLFLVNYRCHHQVKENLSPGTGSDNAQARVLVQILEERLDILICEKVRAKDYKQKMAHRRRVPEPVF